MNKVTIIIGDGAETSKRTGDKHTEARFYGIVKTFASFVPAKFTEVKYYSYPEIFQYDMTVAHADDSIEISIMWKDSNSTKHVCKVNETLYSDILEAAFAFQKLFSN